MSQFRAYFELGIQHILDLNGFDHILFIIALCALYTLRDWRKVLILVTAFTIGHSVTLALSVLNVLTINAGIIEFLIPVTILITALSNIFRKNDSFNPSKIHLNYIYAVVFGLVHGLGFSNYLKSIMGRGTQVVGQLLAFNLGIEAGQVVIVGIFILVAGLVVGLTEVSKREWSLGISAAVAGMALMLILENKFW
ncbi:HupE/UreJ family protein [Nafulsella turpanensis]|uniref:HupE/UreJ family protein n=1 Tax=Nafulsella turpanensis TaxID=1265690 RepID=UPI000347EBE8|nr:HupE/UreJ family protein [Nafulsella turpanensis]